MDSQQRWLTSRHQQQEQAVPMQTARDQQQRQRTTGDGGNANQAAARLRQVNL